MRRTRCTVNGFEDVQGAGREKEAETGSQSAATNLGNLRHSTAQSWIPPTTPVRKEVDSSPEHPDKMLCSQPVDPRAWHSAEPTWIPEPQNCERQWVLS